MADPTQRTTLLKDDSGYPTVVGGYANYTATATNQVKTGPGFLYSIVFNTPVATSVVEYNDATGRSNPMGTITIGTGPQPFTLPINTAFTNGLSVSTGTAASNITVIYR